MCVYNPGNVTPLIPLLVAWCCSCWCPFVRWFVSLHTPFATSVNTLLVGNNHHPCKDFSAAKKPTDFPFRRARGAAMLYFVLYCMCSLLYVVFLVLYVLSCTLYVFSCIFLCFRPSNAVVDSSAVSGFLLSLRFPLCSNCLLITKSVFSLASVLVLCLVQLNCTCLFNQIRAFPLLLCLYMSLSFIFIRKTQRVVSI